MPFTQAKGGASNGSLLTPSGDPDNLQQSPASHFAKAMPALSPELRELIESGPMAHLSTINSDGSPQVTVIWIGLDGDDLVSTHMRDNVKLKNIRRDPAWRFRSTHRESLESGSILTQSCMHELR